MILLRILNIGHPQDLQKPDLRKLCSYVRSCLFYLGCEHRVLRPKFTYQKNPRKLKRVFFGVKPYGEQRLLKALCPLWGILTNGFEKNPFGLLNKVLEGR